MSTWNSRGLRGSTLEELINRTNDLYKEHGLCLVQKIPTPITPIRMNADHSQITLAYFDQKSTVDYIGAVQGIPVCFDAKECSVDTFALSNIHEHQVKFMEDFEKQGGISFIVIYYAHKDRFHYLRCERLQYFWNRMQKGGRKSFRIEELEEGFDLIPHEGLLVPYLDGIKKDLTLRDTKFNVS
ncbi:MAG: Holliday junction resolvase RecU [Lachnospiraceae bacterium]|nr:Holliday junction resolvase RecU [Lachnospiraceae bacterium]